MKRLTNNRQHLLNPKLNNLSGGGMSQGNMNMFNPRGVKYDMEDVKQIMKDKSFLIFHITGNHPKLKQLLGTLSYSGNKSKKDWTTGFYWYDMPEYKEDEKSYPIVYVGFFSSNDKKDFINKLGIDINDTARYVHYPVPVPNKNDTQKMITTYKMNPRYPVYIISKGRWEKRLTSKAFEEAGIPYKIVVEPQEYDNYAEVINPSKILILPKQYLGLNQGGIPARNFVWSHAVKSGSKKHWILDDNIDGFYRWDRNHRWKVKSGVLLRLCEDYVNRFRNIKQAGLNYRMFYPSRQPRPPITFNTRIYSCILLDHELDKILKERWRGRYNEDTDLSIRILKKGYATCLFNAFLCGKEPTLTSSGGNTDGIYAKGSKDALFKKADSLRKQHPDVARVVERYKRGIHHEVNYNGFSNNDLGYKNPQIKKGINNYNMRIVSKTAEEMKGEGIIDFIKNPFGWIKGKTLDGRPRVLNDLLTKEGDKTVDFIRICRTPVQSIIQKLINVFTFGMFKKAIKRMNYDTVFHLYMVLTLSDGSKWSLEKNQRVNVVKGQKEGECKFIQYGKKNLRDFILTAENKNIVGFYRYDAFKDNCQKWIHDIMNANGINQFNKFILQDVSSLAPSLFKKFARGITDVAGVADYVIKGGEYDEDEELYY